MGEDPRGLPNYLMSLMVHVCVVRKGILIVFGDDYDIPNRIGEYFYCYQNPRFFCFSLFVLVITLFCMIMHRDPFSHPHRRQGLHPRRRYHQTILSCPRKTIHLAAWMWGDKPWYGKMLLRPWTCREYCRSNRETSTVCCDATTTKGCCSGVVVSQKGAGGVGNLSSLIIIDPGRLPYLWRGCCVDVCNTCVTVIFYYFFRV